MKLWRNAVCLTLIVCIVSLILLFVFHSYIPLGIWYDISLGVFSSAFVVFILNFVTYFSERRKTINFITYRARNYAQELGLFSSELTLHMKQFPSELDAESVNSLLTNEKLYACANRLCEEYTELMLFGDGFFPIMRNLCDINNKISKLLDDFSSINCIVSQYKFFYDRHNNPLTNSSFANDIKKFAPELWLLSFNNSTNIVLPFTVLMNDLTKWYGRGMLQETKT